MKKFFLSFSVISLFILYVLHQRQDVSNVQVTVPSVQSQTSLEIPSPTSSSAGSAGIPPNSSQNANQANSRYKDGEYIGDIVDAYYGNVQVKITIKGGKITDVVFLDYPHDRRTSMMINSQAMPYLKQEAIQVQNSQVDVVSGATATSGAFITSLESALVKAKG